MTALLIIARNELRLLTRSRPVWFMLGAFLTCALYAIDSGHAWFRARQAEDAALSKEMDQKLTQLQQQAHGAGDPGDLDDVGNYAVFPLSPISALSIGQADFLPRHLEISLMSRQRRTSERFGIENPLDLLAGRLDFAFVTVYLLPLLVLALSFNLLSSEREQGTLPLLLSQPLRLTTIVAGKLVARGLLAGLAGIAIPMMIAALAGELRPVAGVRLLLWTGTSCCYLAFWFSLAVVANLYGRDSAANAVRLAGCWLVLVMVVPSLVNIAVKAIYPPPSRLELIRATRENVQDFRRDHKQLIAEFSLEHPDLPKAESGQELSLAFTLIQSELDRRTAPIEQEFRKQLDQQQSVVNRLRYLSPAILVQESLSDIAGTGMTRFSVYRREADRYAEEWKAWVSDRILRGTKLHDEDYLSVPKFKMAATPTALLVPRLAAAFAGLLIPTLFLMIVFLKRARVYGPQI